MTKGNSGLREQALNKAIETGLSTQLDAAEKLEADVQTDPVLLLQGELQSADIEGEGLVMKRDLRTEKLSMQTDGVAIDPLKAAFGDIELTRPTNAIAVVTLSETDIQRAFNGDYIYQKLQNLEVQSDGQPTRVNVQHVDFKLPGAGKVAIAADVTMPDSDESQHVAFNAVPEVGPQGHQVLLNQVEVEGQGAPSPLPTACWKRRGNCSICATLPFLACRCRSKPSTFKPARCGCKRRPRSKIFLGGINGLR